MGKHTVTHEGNLYVKTGDKGSLMREFFMDYFLGANCLGPKVVTYELKDKLVTEEMTGIQLSSDIYTSHPKKCVEKLVYALKKLHSLPTTQCSVVRREFKGITGTFYTEWLPREWEVTVCDAVHFLKEHNYTFEKDHVIHGDACLPNIFDDGKFIDAGHGGIGDIHIDIFWALWSLWYNLGTLEYTDLFLDLYGRDLVDVDKVKAVCYLECFVYDQESWEG